MDDAEEGDGTRRKKGDGDGKVTGDGMPPSQGQEPTSLLSGDKTITGIGARPELNGQSARIVRFDSETGRYVVKLQDGTKVKLKPANLAPPEVSAWPDEFGQQL